MSNTSATLSRWRARVIWEFNRINEVLWDWRGVIVLAAICLALGWASWKVSLWYLTGYLFVAAFCFVVFCDFLVYISTDAHNYLIPRGWGDIDYWMRMRHGRDWQKKFMDSLYYFGFIFFCVTTGATLYIMFAFHRIDLLQGFGWGAFAALLSKVVETADRKRRERASQQRVMVSELLCPVEVEAPETEEQVEETGS
jgi:hypothetical protein